eukprot:TRINITY_DN173_c0_g1_i7.p1 TRINITY_DN173_c0_g1~~TRINITY_DN173_c0_g1_i7.p1  ORF type:complete len:274 (+),score=57.98 TRINITY_DN173_c0_g1_i7:51-872(+)
MSSSTGTSGVIVGGALAQSIEVLTIGHVLDRIKIEQQVKMQPCRTVFKEMWGKGGVRELYKGVSYNLIQAACKGGGRWCMVNSADWACRNSFSPENRKAHPVLYNGCVGVVAGVAETTLISCPMESLKINTMTNGAGLKGLGDVKLLWNGWTMQVTKQVITWCTFLMAYEHVRQCVYSCKGTKELTTTDKLLVAVGTGAISTVVQAPADVAKTLAQSSRSNSSLGSLTAAYSAKGLPALFSGLSTKLVRHCTTAVVMLLTMDSLDCLPEGMKL